MSCAIAGNELEVLERFALARVVPVATIEDSMKAERLARALLAGGISCIEVTLRTDEALDALQRCRRVDGLLAGAGTVLSVEQARSVAAAGAAFAVAPGTNDEVVAECRQLKLPIFPGVATPTEIEHARSLGLRVMKVFPAELVGGVRFLRAVSAVYRDVGFVPTGGITTANMHEYLSISSVVAVGGSWLTPPELLETGQFDEITRLVREAVELAG